VAYSGLPGSGVTLAMASIKDFTGNGFTRNAEQSASSAALRTVELSLPVIKTAGIEMPDIAIRRRNSIPDAPFKLMSKMRHVASRRFARFSKSSTEPNKSASKPCTFSVRSMTLSMLGSSSTTNMSFRVRKTGAFKLPAFDGAGSKSGKPARLNLKVRAVRASCSAKFMHVAHPSVDRETSSISTI
jgi:hypothetical protein